MADHSIDTCRSCGAAIIWAQTYGGKSMPVNAKPSPTGNVLLGRDRGKVTAAVLGRNRAAGARDAGVALHTNHFVDCKHADTWRRTQ